MSVTPGAAPRQPQQPYAFERTITQTVGCRYWLYVPPGEPRTGGLWPTILYLHGAGERGEDLERVKKHGLPHLIAQGQTMPFIVISPQCPLEQWWDHSVLIHLLDEVAGRWPVDPERTYVTGLSMGGFGTWDLGLRYPDRFAAIAPICGGGPPYLAHRITRLPVWAFHGAKDPVVPLSESQRIVERLKELGGNVRFTVYPNAQHDAWTETYNNPELYAWLLQHRRGGET